MSLQRHHGGPLVVGVDFDNTIATYDELMHRLALELGLISKDVGRSKVEVRDTVRKLPEGEIQWQRLQGSVYGPGMREARLSDGVGIFFHECQERRIKVFIVSHKTEFASFDDTRTNLRQSAMTWMTDKRFFETGGFGLSQKDVFFEGTRREKLLRIAQLGCTHFIDDLREVFDDEGFPSTVRKILYSPNEAKSPPIETMIASSWEMITDYFFRDDIADSELSARFPSIEERR